MIASATMLAVTLAGSTQPDAVRTPDPDIVSPGFAGFLAVFCLAVATVFLIRSMTKHMRKVKYLADRMEQENPPAGPASASVQTPGQS